MLPEEIEKLEKEIKVLKTLLQEREAALPAHSIRPHQMQVVMDLEDKIAEKEAQLKNITGLSTK
jgi:hypothetical protein